MSQAEQAALKDGLDAELLRDIRIYWRMGHDTLDIAEKLERTYGGTFTEARVYNILRLARSLAP